MKKLFLGILLIVLIIIAVPLINSKDSVKTKDINLEDTGEVEKHIVKLIEDEEINTEDKGKIIRALPSINWEDLSEEEEEELKSKMALWIYKAEVKEEEEIDAVIKVSSRFYGEDYMKILEKLAQLYGDNMDEFLRALSENKARVIDLGESFYDLEMYEVNGRSISEDFLYIRDSEKLNDEEKKVGYEFLEIISSCGT